MKSRRRRCRCHRLTGAATRSSYAGLAAGVFPLLFAWTLTNSQTIEAVSFAPNFPVDFYRCRRQRAGYVHQTAGTVCWLIWPAAALLVRRRRELGDRDRKSVV